MRRRLLFTYLSLLACVLVALEAPLAYTYAARETQRMFIDRLNDAARFASLAEPALRTGETVTLQAEVERYHALYGIDVAVVDRDSRVVVSSGPHVTLDSEDARRRLRESLAGERPPINRVVWPWTSQPLVVSEPVGRVEVIGAVVSSSPTVQLRQRVAQLWGVIWLLGLAALVVSWVLAVAMTRWILRPVRQLDATARQITRGTLDARAAAARGPGELRHLAESFNTMADTVIGALERQRQFVDHASHQLRNPLAALRLRIENIPLLPSAQPVLPETFPSADGAASGDGTAAGEGAAAAADHHEQVRLALEETDRLTAILNGLLALARAEGGRPTPERCEIGALVDARLDAWRPLARRYGVSLIRSGERPLAVLAVPGMVDQALDELIGNACKFAGDGATVTVHLERRDGMAELHVIDDGPGLDPAEREQAVTRFWRSRTHQNVDGSGLGLAVLAVMAEASGGHIDLLAGQPSGLDVRLRLPFAAAEPPSADEGSAAPPLTGEQGPGNLRGTSPDDGRDTTTGQSLLSR